EYAHVPFVAEPGSKNKLSKRKIAQYLKNPDFKKVYEHGRDLIVSKGWLDAWDSVWLLQQGFRQAYERSGKTLTEGEVNEQVTRAVNSQLLFVRELNLPPSAIRAGAATGVIASELLADLVKTPGLLDLSKHARRIHEHFPTLAPEAFNPVLVDFYKQAG